MILKSIDIEHFRCLQACSIALERYCPLVGANGAGKSTILEAIRFVLDPRFHVGIEQLNPDCSGAPLRVNATLVDFSKDERARYGAYISSGDELRLTREVGFGEDGAISQYFVSVGCHDAFQPIRDLIQRNDNVPAKNNYNAFVAANAAYGLDAVSKYGDIESNLRTWEQAHPDECVTVHLPISLKDLSTMGWPLIDVIYVPAVKDASDDVGARSPLQRLLDSIVSEPANVSDGMEKLRQYVSKTYGKLYPEDASELSEIATTISEDLAAFAPGSSIQLGWTQDYVPVLDPPPIEVRVVEDAYSSDIGEKGHGVQRAVIMAVISVLDKLQAMLEVASGVAPGSMQQRDLLLLIEEPELYQHPIRARHFADALRKRAASDKPKRTQVVFSTHSPNFISLADFPGIRLLKRTTLGAGRLPHRSIGHTTLDAVAKELYEAQDGPMFVFGGEDLRARLHGILDSSVREGFFADSIVLVEGDNDYSILVGSFQERAFDYEAVGLAVLVANGKNNLDKALVIFRQLQIPVYVVFDGDADKYVKSGASQSSKEKGSAEAKANRALLKLLRQPVVDFPDTTVGNECTYFSEAFDSTVVSELGEKFKGEFEKSCADFGYENLTKARKVPEVFTRTLRALSEQGTRSKTLEEVLDAIEAFAKGARERIVPRQGSAR